MLLLLRCHLCHQSVRLREQALLNSSVAAQVLLLAISARSLHALGACARAMYSHVSRRLWLSPQRAAAVGTLHQEPYKRLNMALFTWATLSAGISIMCRSLWNAQGLM